VSIYLDASVLVSLFVSDALALRADRFISNNVAQILVSDFAAVEFSSAIGRRLRSGDLTTSEADAALTSFDSWTVRLTDRVTVTPQDTAIANSFIRRFQLGLRAPDALHIAMAQRLEAVLASFDEGMRRAANALGVPVVSL
jgi:predicted nucleic acid-binding protein